MRAAVRDHPNTFLTLAVVFAAIFLGIDFAVTLRLSDPQQKIVYSDAVSPIIDLLASAVLFIAAKQSLAHSKRLAAAWGMIALSTLIYTAGDVAWGIIEVGLQEPAFPSIADAFYLAYYLFFLIGVFLLPSQPTTRGEKINNVLDATIVMAAALLGFWNFLLGPIVSSSTGSSAVGLAILLGYPVGDLVLIWALLRIIYKRPDQQDEVPAFLLAGSIIVTVISDCIYTYQSLLGTYVS